MIHPDNSPTPENDRLTEATQRLREIRDKIVESQRESSSLEDVSALNKEAQKAKEEYLKLLEKDKDTRSDVYGHTIIRSERYALKSLAKLNGESLESIASRIKSVEGGHILEIDLSRGYTGQLATPIHKLSDISPLQYLTQLQKLDLNFNAIQDISPLAQLNHLRMLSLSFNNIEDISPLQHLTQLQALYLRDNAIQDISPLAQLNNLILLHLSFNKIEDLSPVAQLNRLESLTIARNLIHDVSPLQGLHGIRHLYIAGNKIFDCSPLRNLPLLTELSLNGSPSTNFASLAELTQVEQLTLDDNWLERMDFRHLAGLSRLKKLSVRDCRIQEVSSLAGLAQLEEVDLRGNVLTDISPLSELQKLKKLSISFNGVLQSIFDPVGLFDVFTDINSVLMRNRNKKAYERLQKSGCEITIDK